MGLFYVRRIFFLFPATYPYNVINKSSNIMLWRTLYQGCQVLDLSALYWCQACHKKITCHWKSIKLISYESVIIFHVLFVSQLTSVIAQSIYFDAIASVVQWILTWPERKQTKWCPGSMCENSLFIVIYGPITSCKKWNNICKVVMNCAWVLSCDVHCPCWLTREIKNKITQQILPHTGPYIIRRVFYRQM